MNIIVASTNPVKINAAREVFQQVFPAQAPVVIGQSAPSGVRDQPVTSAETLTGAHNRLHFIRQKYQADFWVSFEGGLEDDAFGMAAFAWVVVAAAGKVSQSKSATFYIPHQARELILQGHELGPVNDKIYGLRNSKHQNGAIGILTNDLITRTSLYSQALLLALPPFMNPQFFE